MAVSVQLPNPAESLFKAQSKSYKLCVAAGFMSNRGRQNVASYLVLDMGVDWRRGADWFETVLQDYDVCSNWGNWVAAAGLTGGRINHFNITKQSKVSVVQGACTHGLTHLLSCCRCEVDVCSIAAWHCYTHTFRRSPTQ